MRIIVFTGILVCLLAQLAFGQANSMYDQSYSGPVNIYGQPALTQLPKTDQAGANQNGFQGIAPMAGDLAKSAGSYIWSYMPAPVRGAQSPYYVPPGQGQVITNFVPGN
jgi:hypothetical protein